MITKPTIPGKRLRVEIGPELSRFPTVTDAETGEPLSVTSVKIEWDVNSGRPPILTVQTYKFEASVSGNARVITLCPACKKERDDLHP